MSLFLKKIIPPSLANVLLYRWQQLINARSNQQFKELHPEIILPDAYTLYESYQLNYKKYIEDGKLTAAEIIEAVVPYLSNTPTLLDWGCGPARITRHLAALLPTGIIKACDSNTATIAWNQQNIPGIEFALQDNFPPLPFTDQHFDLIIGFSVFTHIPAVLQQDWLTELYRLLKPQGILWITTHGNYFIKQLSKEKQEQIVQKGIYNTNYPTPGHRMMTTYHQPEKWRELLEEKFELFHYYDGETYPNKAGKQDLWILRKKKV